MKKLYNDFLSMREFLCFALLEYNFKEPIKFTFGVSIPFSNEVSVEESYNIMDRIIKFLLKTKLNISLKPIFRKKKFGSVHTKKNAIQFLSSNDNSITIVIQKNPFHNPLQKLKCDSILFFRE